MDTLTSVCRKETSFIEASSLKEKVLIKKNTDIQTHK